MYHEFDDSQDAVSPLCLRREKIVFIEAFQSPRYRLHYIACVNAMLESSWPIQEPFVKLLLPVSGGAFEIDSPIPEQNASCAEEEFLIPRKID